MTMKDWLKNIWSRKYRILSNFFYAIAGVGTIIIVVNVLFRVDMPKLAYFLTTSCFAFGLMFNKFHEYEGIRKTFME